MPGETKAMPNRADILITGANGFIGRGLIPVLLGRGKRLRGLYRRLGPAEGPAK